LADDIIIGGYRRLAVMQVGQNSEVWEVAELGSHRRFAMKLLLPEKVRNSDQRRMLRLEAKLGMKFRHPNIIRVFSFSNNRDNPFLIMEYFPSPNLKLRLMRGQYDEFVRPRLRPLFDQIAGALEYVHEQGWVHRDVKPDNVLVNGAGEVRVIDFALAVRTASRLAIRFGRRGRTAGTRSYMSPEQIMGYPLDQRADIYSFGVMAYEMVAGRLPFVAQTGTDLLKKHMSADIPAIDSSRNVTREFEDFLRRLMAKKPAGRPERFVDVISTLRSLKIFKDELVLARAASKS
jgi:serine/threonine protein kinase